MIAGQTDSGCFATRCNGCLPEAAYPDSATVHISDPVDHSYAQWRVHRLVNGRIALLADTSRNMGRYNHCHRHSSQRLYTWNRPTSVAERRGRLPC
ncbi:TPA: hypothetical protein N0F65_000292 [Lagenidium giganteum]|uniref:Uncharacterized protein n=1 Tax=Lagenidium giganteum TaxID=4803 RepID=A0AAV2ZBR7_9STRA|nr:TPA: hypothetical protein N0F65_000292 [Lagenidium giganteum]